MGINEYNRDFYIWVTSRWEAIYKKRREILNIYNKEKNGEENNRKLSDIILEMVKTEINQVVDFHTPLENKVVPYKIFKKGFKIKLHLVIFSYQH